ncbi:hypothetical protein [Lacrimispora brassicae]
MKKNDLQKKVIPKELQIDMLNFFLRTSIPRKIKMEKENNYKTDNKSSIKNTKR